MYLKNDFYEIEIRVIKKITEDSLKNMGYDYIYNPGNKDVSDEFMKYYDIFIKSEENSFKIALFGDYYIYEKDCAVIENDILTLLLNDEIVSIDVRTCELVRFIKYEITGLGDHIYKVPGKYIVKGKQNIVGLDEEFKRIWSFGTRDIFECIDEKEPFAVCEDRIKLYDFLDDYFELDFDGNVIKEIINKNAEF